MNILAITYCFAPLRFPATYRLLKWFSYLTEIGHSVTVIAVHPESFRGPKDATLSSLVPEGVETVTAWSKENALLYRLLRKQPVLFRRLLHPFKMEWYSPAMREMRSLPLDRFDVVFSCSQPPVCHLLGRDISRLSGLPWVAFFSDPWADNPFGRKQPRKIHDHNLRLERSVITSADAIVFTCEEMRRHVVKKYGSEEDQRSRVLPHCYKPDWYEKKSTVQNREDGASEILLTGSFYGPRSLIPLLGALRRLNQRRPLAGRLRLHVYGGMSEPERQDSVWNDVGSFVHFHGSTDYLSSLALMRQADYLLLIDAPVAKGEESIFFPSKLADYLGSGTPVIGLTPESGASARILAETGCIACEVEDLDAIEEVFASVAGGKLRLPPRQDEIEKYDYRHVVERLDKILRSSLSDRRQDAG